MSKVYSIALEDLFQQHQNTPSTALILDVRSPQEFAEGHVPGSKNISHTDLPARTAELASYKKVVIYCRSGGRAQVSADILRKAGLDSLEEIAVVSSGGMPDWVMCGYPVEN